MDRRTSGKTFLPITVLIGHCIVLSSAAFLPTIRNSNRPWNRELSDQSLSNKQMSPFFSGPGAWDNQLPSIALHDWSLRMMTSDTLPNEPSVQRINKFRLKPVTRQFLFSSDDLSKKALTEVPRPNSGTVDQRWPPDWPTNEELDKRSIVVADDAAFRERSKMLTAMERQKWLNSYMQKLLVVNSK